MALNPIVSPALRLILVNRLQKVLHSWQNNQQLTEKQPVDDLRNSAITTEYSNLSEIPLNRVQENQEICYVSAIAFRLASFWQQSAAEIAHQLVTLLHHDQTILDLTTPDHGLDCGLNRELDHGEDFPPNFNRIWQSFHIYVLPPGWIHLKLQSIGLAEWLQLLVDQSPFWCNPGSIEQHPFPYNTRNSTRIFEVLYTYARCASLLRLGSQAKLVHITPTPSSIPLPGYIVYPHPLPWLTPEKRLQCHQLTEADLIAQIIDGWDTLGTLNCCWEQQWKAASCLSQQFQMFYRSCRIFGEVATTTLAIAQTRLGLVSITQTLLYHLIGQGVPLPIEL